MDIQLKLEPSWLGVCTLGIAGGILLFSVLLGKRLAGSMKVATETIPEMKKEPPEK